jgi:YbgC/YbaW family acyl-CoA thioester hydrolase
MFFDTDCGGVVSNIAYLRFIEIARTHLAEELGLAVVEMAQKETYPVVVRTEIDYRRAAKLGDRLVIEGWLDRVERARFWCAFRITRPQDNTLIAECRQMLALIEMPTENCCVCLSTGKRTTKANPANMANANPEPERFPVEKVCNDRKRAHPEHRRNAAGTARVAAAAYAARSVGNSDCARSAVARGDRWDRRSLQRDGGPIRRSRARDGGEP